MNQDTSLRKRLKEARALLTKSRRAHRRDLDNLANRLYYISMKAEVESLEHEQAFMSILGDDKPSK